MKRTIGFEVATSSLELDITTNDLGNVDPGLDLVNDTFRDKRHLTWLVGQKTCVPSRENCFESRPVFLGASEEMRERSP